MATTCARVARDMSAKPKSHRLNAQFKLALVGQDCKSGSLWSNCAKPGGESFAHLRHLPAIQHKIRQMNSTKLRLMPALACAAALLLCNFSHAADKKANRPNVVVILIDDMGFSD